MKQKRGGKPSLGVRGAFNPSSVASWLCDLGQIPWFHRASIFSSINENGDSCHMGSLWCKYSLSHSLGYCFNLHPDFCMPAFAAMTVHYINAKKDLNHLFVQFYSSCVQLGMVLQVSLNLLPVFILGSVATQDMPFWGQVAGISRGASENANTTGGWRIEQAQLFQHFQTVLLAKGSDMVNPVSMGGKKPTHSELRVEKQGKIVSKSCLYQNCQNPWHDCGHISHHPPHTDFMFLEAYWIIQIPTLQTDKLRFRPLPIARLQPQRVFI
jgi:hypothetical protein